MNPIVDLPLFMCMCYSRALLAYPIYFALPMSYYASPYHARVYYAFLLPYYDLIPLDLEGSDNKT